MTTAATAAPAPESARAVSLVDCDVHPYVVGGLLALAPYMTATWRRRIFGDADPRPHDHSRLAGQLVLPSNQVYINPAGLLRRDAYTPSGGMPGSDPDVVVEAVLDKLGVDRALLLVSQACGICALADPDVAATIASAYNEWLFERWIQHDRRFRMGMIVAPQDPQLAAAEIDRVGNRDGVAAVLLPFGNILLGERHYYPIYEAAERHGLPIAIHPNAVDGVHQRAATFGGGSPTYYVEWHVSITQVFQAHVVSLIAHGVFERFPALKVLVAEGGFAWLAEVMWRFDKDWSALRDEVPWLKRPPSEYIVDHLRFTTQPFIEPKRREHLHAILEIVDAARTLVFSSDYPHWDFDDPTRLLQTLPADIRSRVAADNAVEIFGDRIL